MVFLRPILSASIPKPSEPAIAVVCIVMKKSNNSAIVKPRVTVAYIEANMTTVLIPSK